MGLRKDSGRIPFEERHLGSAISGKRIGGWLVKRFDHIQTMLSMDGEHLHF